MTMIVFNNVIDVESARSDRASLTEKYARKDEKMLFWPPPISLIWLQNQRVTKQRRNTSK